MQDENSTLNNEATQQGSAASAVVEESSQTTAHEALAADDAAIFGSVPKQASEPEEKNTPVASVQDEPPAEADGETNAVTTPTKEQTSTGQTEKQEPTDAEIEAMPEEIRGKARRERQFNRLISKVKASDEAAAAERAKREQLEKQIREQIAAKGSTTQTQPTVQPPPEVVQARYQAEVAWNETVAAVQNGTKSEADAVAAWNAVKTAYQKEGEWIAEQRLRANQLQQQQVVQVEREQREALNTLAELSGDDPRFDMSDDIADPQRRANPQTPFGKMVHELSIKQFGRPVATWAELEGLALKASLLVQKGQAKLSANKAKIADNQARNLATRIGLESSARHAPPPRSVGSENSDLRKRLSSDDPKVRQAARYELFESEARSHGLA